MIVEMQDNYDHCRALVREADRDRYLAALLAAREQRGDLLALYAFNVELSLVADRARDPLAGEARLQWWLLALDNPGGEASANPVASALNDTISRRGLDREPLKRVVRARMADLYDDMPDEETFRTYLRDAAGAVFENAARIAGVAGDLDKISAAAGLAYGTVQLLRNFAFHAHKGKVFIPIDLLARHGADREAIVRGQSSSQLLCALAEMRAFTREHLEIAEDEMTRLPRTIRAVFTPLALVEPYLRQMEKPGYEPFKTPIEIPQWKRQWLLWRAR